MDARIFITMLRDTAMNAQHAIVPVILVLSLMRSRQLPQERHTAHGSGESLLQIFSVYILYARYAALLHESVTIRI